MNLLDIIFIFLFLSVIKSIDSNSIQLGQNWKMVITQCPPQFSNINGKQYNVSVPSTLHLNLQKYNQIPNPYFGTNLKILSSLSECSAKFIRTIQMDQDLSQYSQAIIRFQGIDTYSSIYLNDIKVGETQNAFLKYQFNVKPHLKIGNNQLVVQIKSTNPIDREKQKTDRMPFDYAQTRKACYQYSWDWAPYMNTVGIWLPVSLVLSRAARFQYVWIRNKQLTQHRAVLDFTVALDGIQDKQKIENSNLQIRLFCKNTHENLRFAVLSKYSSFKVLIKQPKLWWPNNIGEPYIYQYELTLIKNGEIWDRKNMIHGIRTVKLDSQGRNFRIIVNGYPIYCKGANYVPPDMMYPRLINKEFVPANTIQNLLNDVVESNFNMIRVWGGGQYQTDEFYELASRKGIMIFQDFIFSDSIYPGTDQFLQNVQKEVIYQVRRLRNYPALVLWSGNNQILQGIISWGWGQPKYRQNYNKLFLQLIPDILNVECNYIPYIESSPSKGVGNGGFQQGGDVHYWGVWAAASPFENYETAIGGFNSEFGTQSLPVWQTVLQFADPNGRSYQSEQLEFHEKHSSRFNTLRGYIGRYSKQALNFELQTYNSGLVQAYGLQIAIRAQRCSKPKSFGTLYWQLNDAWPSISWSSIDYYGRWKPLQFLAKQYFKDIILFYHPHTGKFVAINDKLFNIKANIVIKLMKFDGTVIHENSGSITLKANQKKELGILDSKLFSGVENQAFVFTEITYGNHEENKTTTTAFFRHFADLVLDPATLNVKYIYDKNQILLSSNYLIKNLYVSCSKMYLRFSDNYFDVVPGHPKKIKIIRPFAVLEELKPYVMFRSYRQIFDPAGLPVQVQN